MKQHYQNFFLIIFLFCSAVMGASAEQLREGVRKTETMVVSPSSMTLARSETGSAVTVINREEIERSGKHLLLDLLRGQLGVDVVRSGGPGGNTAVFIRGANSEHTLVVIDGVEVNNPITPNRAFNFADVPLDNIEQIEILRGPQSTVYGSDALGGVINVTTRKGEGELSAFVEFEGGSYETFTERADVSGASKGMDYSLTFSRQDSDSFSAADESDGNIEDDSYENTSFTARVGKDFSENIKGHAIVRYTDARTDLDNAGGVAGDDPNRNADNEQLVLSTGIEGSFFEKKWRPALHVGFSDQDFTDDNDFDAMNPDDFLRSAYSGQIFETEATNTLELADELWLVFGYEYEHEEASSTLYSESTFGPLESNFTERSAHTHGYFADVQTALFDRVYTTAGLRVDDYSAFGSEVTYRIAPSVQVPETGTRFRGSVGSGFKAPSLFQLYSDFGSPDLNAEESLGWDIGIEQEILEEKLFLEVGYFQNDFDELISFDPNTFLYENISEAEVSGFEIALSAQPVEALGVRAGYTYTDTKDTSTGSSLLRRARNKFRCDLDFDQGRQWRYHASLTYVGDRFDNNFGAFPAERVNLGNYTLLDILVSFQATENIELFIRGENLLDEDYEEVFGYGVAGVSGFGGIRIAL